MSKRPKHPPRDKPLLTIVAIALAVLAIGFAGAWLYLRHAQKLEAQVRYLTLPAVAISQGGYSMRATVAVRTNGADTSWASDHKAALEALTKQALMAADPQRMRSTGGLQAFEESLKANANASLHTDKLQQVLVTDFLVSEGDY